MLTKAGVLLPEQSRINGKRRGRTKWKHVMEVGVGKAVTRPMIRLVIAWQRLMLVHQHSPAENEVEDKTGKETA